MTSVRNAFFAILCVVSSAALSATTPVRPVLLSKSAVKASVLDYARARGFRPGLLEVEVLGASKSGKSTRAKLWLGLRPAVVATNHATGRVQPSPRSGFFTALIESHEPLPRAELGASSKFAVAILELKNGAGAGLGSLGKTALPLGRPRAGQSAGAVALDAYSLGTRGSLTLRMGRAITAGAPGAGFIVRENGLGQGTIENQTPALVEVSDGARWYRLGYAGYATAGDRLLVSAALDPIPAGSKLTTVRITDDPSAPHVPDPTNNAQAAARGVAGFDLVSVEALLGGPRATGPVR